MKQEPYTIETKELAWLAKAVATDTTRPAMTMGALAFYEGAAVIVATDSHRLHLLRLGPVGKEFTTRSIDLRRILFEAKYAKADTIQIDLDDSEVFIGNFKKGAVANQAKIHAPVYGTVDGRYPDFARVIPKETKPVSWFFKINPRYLTDVMALGKYGVVLSGNSPNMAIVFRDREKDGRWLGVVMPMALDWPEVTHFAKAKAEKGSG